METTVQEIKKAFRDISEGGAARVAEIIATNGKEIDRSCGSIDSLMEELNGLLDCYGVEGLNDNGGKCRALYVNSGDTYSATVLYDIGARIFILTTWGDWLETNETNYNFN